MAPFFFISYSNKRQMITPKTANNHLHFKAKHR
jgi:hypothetical protein